MVALRVLAVAAATGRVACVFFVGDRLRDWRVSEKAAKSPENAAGMVQSWINELQPGVVVTEACSAQSTKGAKTQSLIAAVGRTAAQNYLLDVCVTPAREHKNKYDEAQALAERYPELAPWVPKPRRFFDKEPRNIVLFEAVSLALSVLQRPSTTLAAAMS